MSNHLPEVGKGPCTYCGHADCGGGRPFDSSHEARYCVACWAENNVGRLAAQSLTPWAVDQAEILQGILEELKMSNALKYEAKDVIYPSARPAQLKSEDYKIQPQRFYGEEASKPKTAKRGL